jgi:hypothetical protein
MELPPAGHRDVKKEGKKVGLPGFRRFNSIKTNRVCVGVLSQAGTFTRLVPGKNFFELTNYESNKLKAEGLK